MRTAIFFRRVLTISAFIALMFSQQALAGDNSAAHLSISCAKPAQKSFDAGLAMLHSFEYATARREFERASARDPKCAMAYWGAAMTMWHPLWAPPTQADLERGASILKLAAPLARTAREDAYLTALSKFFSSADVLTHASRARAFETDMRALHLADRDDREAALFYALSLLATADPRDKTYASQYRAGAILALVGVSAPLHPGVLHYTIHAYDFPPLAYLALPAAQRYANAAPDSAHAQHMPSHIFVRLGMWEEAIRSNVDSTRSAAEYTHREHLDGHYDEGLHSLDYLTYALLQTGRDADAADLLNKLRALGKPNESNFKAAFTYASSPARFALERGAWREAAALKIEPADFPWREFPWALSITHFARGVGAAKSGDIDGARSEEAAIKRLEAALAPTTLPYWREEVAVQRDLVDAAILAAQGKVDEALTIAAAAADREDAVDKHPVTPGEVLPARELYGDMLLEAGHAGDALAAFETVLSHAPNRLNALIGAARAAKASGAAEKAQNYQERALSQAAKGDRKIEF